MPVTTRSLKRQLQEAQDTCQSTSATEVKISKPEDQKVQSSVVADSEDLQQKKCQMGEEKPKGKNILKRLPCEIICHVFRYLPDRDLFNQMLTDRFFEKSAGYVLQRRKLSLYSLKTTHGKETILEVNRKHEQYDLKVENASAICEGYEAQKGNNLTRAIYLLFTYYNCSVANVNSYNSDEIPLTLEAFFGPSDPCEKTNIRYLTLTSHTAPMLRWFRPNDLCVRDSPNWLIETSKKELKELIAGIDQITFVDSHIGCVDKMVEACDAKNIAIGSNSYWSDESILSVVKANIDANDNGTNRRMIYCKGRANSQWKELFAHLIQSYEGYGSNNCLIKMPKCTFRYSGCRFIDVQLVFH